ncbi:hypothetical protein SNE40_014023 [Patella caerulea]|uniref:Protein kinase domain-containing protein n=1 Tax=Patella caerulea TaxID=87958 RepID=A0AAN8JHB7_PATCE
MEISQRLISRRCSEILESTNKSLMGCLHHPCQLKALIQLYIEIYRDISCQTVDPTKHQDISCQTFDPVIHRDIRCQTVDQVIHRDFSSQTESRQTATRDSTEASAQAVPLLTNINVYVQAVSECTQAVVPAASTLIAPAIRNVVVSKTPQVQTTRASNLTIVNERRLKEAYAKTSKDCAVLALITSNVDAVSSLKHPSVHRNEQQGSDLNIQIRSASPTGTGRKKLITSAAAGEAPSFSGVVDFKSVVRCNLLRFKSHSAMFPGKGLVILKRIQYSCPMPMMGIVFPNKIRKPRLEFILGDEPTVKLTSSAALLDPTYFVKKAESCHQEEDGIVQESILNGSMKEKFDIASLIYIDSFGDFCMNHSVMMDMFGYDPRDSPFLPSGYEASNDLPKDLYSVYVPSIRSRDIVFFNNEDESFKEIGRGSYGVVYLGRLLKTSKKIVVKDFSNETVCWEFVEHEAQIVALLQGKDITPTFHGLLSSTINENDHSLVQDFFGSGSIETILKHHGELSAASWIRICMNTSKTLLKIHRCHVLHNDVKADNILVDLDGFDVRFIDFGMSTFRKGLEFTASPDYMARYQFLAPEVRENCHTTPQGDVFSLGFLFCQIMTHAKVVQLRPLWKACTSVRALSRPKLPDIIMIIATLEELYIKFAA